MTIADLRDAIDDLDFALALLTPTATSGVALPGQFLALSASAGLAGRAPPCTRCSRPSFASSRAIASW